MGWKLAKNVADSWGHLSGNSYKVLNAMAWATFDEAGEHERWGWIEAGDYFGGPERLAQIALGRGPDDAASPAALQRVKVALSDLVKVGAIVQTEKGRRGYRARYRVVAGAVDNRLPESTSPRKGYGKRTDTGTESVPNSTGFGTENVLGEVRKTYPLGGQPKEGTSLGGNNSMNQVPHAVSAPRKRGPVDQSGDEGEGDGVVLDFTSPEVSRASAREAIAAAQERAHG